MATNLTTGSGLSTTGTGDEYMPWDLRGPVAVFKALPNIESSYSAAAKGAQLLLRRTDPKPTKTYDGVLRNEIKLTVQFADAAGKLWPMIGTVTTQLPVFATAADKAAFVTCLLCAAVSDEGVTALNSGVVPQ